MKTAITQFVTSTFSDAVRAIWVAYVRYRTGVAARMWYLSIFSVLTNKKITEIPENRVLIPFGL
jgi:hypothetical protein